VEEPLRQTCFDPLLTLHVSDKSEAVLQKPNLRVRCQVLREIACPATSPSLQEIRCLHHGLLGTTPEALDEATGDLRRWSRGGIHIDVPEDRLHLLGMAATQHSTAQRGMRTKKEQTVL
jgi:hypothetical protein